MRRNAVIYISTGIASILLSGLFTWGIAAPIFGEKYLPFVADSLNWSPGNAILSAIFVTIYLNLIPWVLSVLILKIIRVIINKRKQKTIDYN